MTILFSYASKSMIVMIADSAITNEINGKFEFTRGAKIYPIKGIGCVSTWGERTGNRIGQLISNYSINSEIIDIYDLRNEIYKYLNCKYRPKEAGLGAVGYHIGGFDRKGNPKLFHVCWDYIRQKGFPPSKEPAYQNNDHTKQGKYPVFLYNGRNDLAEIVISTMLDQIHERRNVRYNFNNPMGFIQLGDLVVRFAAEITREVKPPFITNIISPKNEMKQIQNDRFSPMDPKVINDCLKSLCI